MKLPGEKASTVVFVLLLVLVIVLGIDEKVDKTDIIANLPESFPEVFPSPTPTTVPIPSFYEIPMRMHVFQTFNNCGPATLSMALSYVDLIKSQQELGQILRPFQVPGGDNDDKSVTLQEVADQAEKYGFVSYLRPNGDIEKTKRFIAQGIPVVTRTWLKADEDIGHYRIIRGYDDSTSQIIQDDSLQGNNLSYTFEEFVEIWQPFNYEYLVIVPESKKGIVEAILGEELDEKKAWDKARVRIEQELLEKQNNIHLLFALSRIYYYLGDYEKSIEYFDRVEGSLSFRTLWYQIEPILALYESGDYDRVIQLSGRIIENQNRAFSELYVIRGNIYRKQGNIALAKEEYEKAILYNSGFIDKVPNL